MTNREDETGSNADSRRKFLATAGKAAVVAPAVALLLSASARQVMAKPYGGGGSPGPHGGKKGNNGWGNGGGDGSPNGKTDKYR